MKEGIRITIEATINKEMIEKLQHGGKLYIFTEKPVDSCEATDDQFEEDDDSQGNEKYVHSHPFAKKLLLIVCGIVAALVVAHILIANVYLPNKVRDTFHHYIQVYTEEGANAISCEELDDFRETYGGVNVYHDRVKDRMFWQRYALFRTFVGLEKVAIANSEKR